MPSPEYRYGLSQPTITYSRTEGVDPGVLAQDIAEMRKDNPGVVRRFGQRISRKSTELAYKAYAGTVKGVEKTGEKSTQAWFQLRDVKQSIKPGKLFSWGLVALILIII